MTGNRQMTIGNRKGAKTNCVGERMTLLGKKVRSRGKGQCPIDKGQLQYHAHVICDLELGIGSTIFPICPQIYGITRQYSTYMSIVGVVHCLCTSQAQMMCTQVV